MFQKRLTPPANLSTAMSMMGVGPRWPSNAPMSGYTYAQLQERVNRVGNGLKTVLKVRMEERVLLFLLDRPEISTASSVR